MKLSTEDKVIIGAAIVLCVVPVILHYETKKIEKSSIHIERELKGIRYDIERTEKLIRYGNSRIEKGNEMLRGMVKKKYAIAS